MTLPNVSHGDIHGLIGVIKTNFFFFFFEWVIKTIVNKQF